MAGKKKNSSSINRQKCYYYTVNILNVHVNVCSQALVYRKVDNAVTVRFLFCLNTCTYPVNNNLSSGKCYPAFKQPELEPK